MVHRILEGLRDEAFELARDIGVESLTAPGGLRSFVEKMREIVFPRATKEARELFPDRSTVSSPGNPESPCCRTYPGDDDGGS